MTQIYKENCNDIMKLDGFSQYTIDPEDYYHSKEGYIVYTEKYHLKRGYCCEIYANTAHMD